jgi:hypothetical protein
LETDSEIISKRRFSIFGEIFGQIGSCVIWKNGLQYMKGENLFLEIAHNGYEKIENFS